MIAHVMSDLHLGDRSRGSSEDFWKKLAQKAAEDSPEVAIVAGDILSQYKEFYEEEFLMVVEKFLAIYPKILFVAGNHDFWDSNIEKRTEFFCKISTENPKLYFLDHNRSFRDDRLSIDGATMWFPKHERQKAWCDFQEIKGALDGSIEREHNNFIKSVKTSSIFVTHHLPTEESIFHTWKNFKNNVFFHAQIDETLKIWSASDQLPRLWIHGHTHQPFDYVSKWGFRVYCNPFGNEFEGRNPEFFNKLKVDLSPYTKREK